jgi:hypothetical protein
LLIALFVAYFPAAIWLESFGNPIRSSSVSAVERAGGAIAVVGRH